MKNVTEGKLQQVIFTSHWNQYPTERRRLFAVNNNSFNQIKGAQMKSIGVVAGVSDMIYLSPRSLKPIWLELKVYTGGRQSEKQKDFQKLVEGDGYKYYLIRSVKDFNEATGLNIRYDQK